MIKKLKNKLNNDANLKELLSGSAVTFVIKVTGMLIGYLVVLFISRKYGADGVGVYGLTIKSLNFLAIFGAIGMNVSVLRYVGQYAQKKEVVFWLRKLYVNILQFVFPFSVLIAFLLFYFAEKIAVYVFDNASYVFAFRLGAFVLPLYTINLINIEFIRGLKKLRFSEFFRSISRQIIIFILITLPILIYGQKDVVLALTIGIFGTFVFSSGYVLNFIKKNKAKKSCKIKNITKKELLKTSTPMMVTTVTYFYFTNSGSMFLEAFSTTNQVGIFNVCLQLSMLVSMVLVVVNTISAPKFSELYWQNKPDELQEVIDHSNRLVFIGSICISLILIITASWILTLYGEEYKAGVIPLIILVVGQLINALAGATGTILNMCGYQAILKNITIITAVVSSALFLTLTPLYGILGVCITVAAGQIIYNISSSIYIFKKANIRTFYNPIVDFKKK